MKSDKSTPNVPTLRFSDDDWKFNKIGTISRIITGGTPSTTNEKYWNGTIPWMPSGDIHKKYIREVSKTISEEGFYNSSTKRVPKGSILIALAGQGKTRGTVAISEIDTCINQSIAAIIPEEKVNPYFVFHYLESKYDNLRLISSGDGGRGGLNKEIISNYSISYPPLEFQVKIAQFLSLIDRRIATQNKIISKYESLIKGIYTQLQTNTQKREHCLSNIVKYNSVGLLSKEDLIENGAKKCILYGELFTTYDEVIGEIHSKTNVDGYISKGNEILFPSSTTVDAMSLIAPSALNEQGVLLGGDMFVLEMKSGFNNEYVSYYLNIIAKRTFAKYAQGTTITHLYFEHIKNLPLYLPNITIQTSIASIMKKIKKKIEIEKEMLSALQRQKAFLLKSMFI